MKRGVITFGETMAMMSTDKYGRMEHATSLALGVGGSESNMAIGLRRLGVDVTWLGRVGSDPFGDLILREIGAEGVNVLAVRDAEAPTALMFKERRTPTHTNVWYSRAGSAGSRLNMNDVDFDLIKQSVLLHVTGISPALSSDLEALTMEAIRVARDAGVVVSFDLNFRSKLWTQDRAREVYRRIIPLADIVFGSADEVAIAVGEAATPLELAHRLIGMGAGEAVVKLGAEGAVCVVDGLEYSQPAVPIDAVDTVGAGDAFVAGYLADFLLKRDVQARLVLATTVAAFTCLVVGDWEGFPRRNELEALASREPVNR